MVKKLLRRLLVFLAVVVLVPLLLLAVAAIFMPRDRIRDEIATRVTEQTGAEVTLGDASVRLLPRLGVTLSTGHITGTGVALSERTGSSTKIETYDVVLDELSVDVALRPLLGRKLEIVAVHLVGPDLSLSWQGGETTARQYDITVRDLSLSFDADEQGARRQAPVGGETIPLGERIPEDLSCTFDGTLGEIVLQGAVYDHVTFDGELDARVMTVTGITAERAGGRLQGDLEIDFERDPRGELDFEAEVEAVPADALLEPWVPDLARRLDGQLSGQVSGTGRLGGSEPVLDTLDLTGDLGSGDGVLRAGDWLRDILPYLGARQDLRNISFSRLDHRFRIEKGRYLVQDLLIDGHETDWSGNGWIGLQGAIDLGLRVKLPPGFTPELGQWTFLADALRDGDGRINLDLKLTGRSASPAVDVDLSKLHQAGTDGSASALQKGLGGLLDKWKSR